jgi:hypothetical protein
MAVMGALLLAAAAFWLGGNRPSQQHAVAAEPTQLTMPLAEVASGPRIIFRNTAIGPDYGRVAMVRLHDPGGKRAFTDLSCDRVFGTGRETLCLASDRGVVSTWSAKVYDSDGGAREIPLTGSPSRARLSADGHFSATTSFVAGDSYEETRFSTRTVVTDLTTGRSLDLEDFTLVHGGQQVRPVDRNYWGVTFASDDNTFFVTVAFGGATHLATGTLSSRTVHTLRNDAECPSLSPDGTKVAYKKQGNRAHGDWRLAVLDLKTGKETPINEHHSVDDQVEWLDDEHILYGLPGEGSQAAQTNVWLANADGTGGPRLLIPSAWSPAVIR